MINTHLTLYPNSDLYNLLQLAPHGHGYLFRVSRRGSAVVTFLLTNWEASEYTIRWLEREGDAVQVYSIAYEPDEDFLNRLFEAARPPFALAIQPTTVPPKESPK